MRRSLQGGLVAAALATGLLPGAPALWAQTGKAVNGAVAPPLAEGSGELPRLDGSFQLVGPRALYVWDGTIPGDPARTDALVDFCGERGIGRVFIECSPVGYGAPGAVARYGDFIAALNGAAIDVYALSGYPWFTVSPSAGLPGQPTSWLEGWALYETVVASGLGFTGIVDDSAPYGGLPYTLNGVTYDYFWDDTELCAQGYLDYLRGVKQRIGALELIHTIPYWYDVDPQLTLALDGSAQALPLNLYVQQIVDTANVLDYRDHAFGPQGIISQAIGEVQAGPVMIGVETLDLGPAQSESTFFEESLSTMELELFWTWLAYRHHVHFAGLTIHDYEAYQQKQ